MFGAINVKRFLLKCIFDFPGRLSPLIRKDNQSNDDPSKNSGRSSPPSSIRKPAKKAFGFSPRSVYSDKVLSSRNVSGVSSKRPYLQPAPGVGYYKKKGEI